MLRRGTSGSSSSNAELDASNDDKIRETDSIDILVEISRIKKILDNAILKTELVLCLPLLIKNEFELLQSCMEESDLRFVREVCQRYQEDGSSEGISKKQPFTTADREDPDMCRMINIVFSNNQVMELCKERLVFQISAGGESFLRSLKALRRCVMKRFVVTPKMEVEREAELARIYHRNELAIEEMRILEAKLAQKNSEAAQAIHERDILVAETEAKIQAIHNKCTDELKQRVLNSEKQMHWDWKVSEYKQETLQSTVKETALKLENLLKDHVAYEKDLRTKRYKTESQLASILEKYDLDIGDRQQELEEITADYKEEQNQMALLQGRYEEQDVEYKFLMEEKADYESALLVAKLYAISSRIAACKIQRFFRTYLATRKKSKKGKGKKGKKK